MFRQVRIHHVQHWCLPSPSNCRAGASHCRAMLVHGSPVALERSETPHVASAAAQAALVQRNRSVTAVSLLSSSLGAPVDPASFPADGFPSMAVSTSGSAAGGGPGLPVAAIAGIAAGAAALALAVCRAPARGSLRPARGARHRSQCGVVCAWQGCHPGEQHRSCTSDQQSLGGNPCLMCMEAPRSIRGGFLIACCADRLLKTAPG